MRRRKLTVTLTVGFVGALLVVPNPASAGPSAQPAGPPAAGQTRQHGAPPVALSAVEQISRSSLGTDGKLHTTEENNLLYRDGLGRTRHESGSVVTIDDSVAGSSVRMDTKAGTYTKVSAPSKPAEPPAKSDASRHGSIGGRRSPGTPRAAPQKQPTPAPAWPPCPCDVQSGHPADGGIILIRSG